MLNLFNALRVYDMREARQTEVVFIASELKKEVEPKYVVWQTLTFDSTFLHEVYNKISTYFNRKGKQQAIHLLTANVAAVILAWVNGMSGIGGSDTPSPYITGNIFIL
ncbi:hypothetical protein BDQ17DRAFT_1326025 [Cyathus striatus]|nr:hypothetical protein BDQ17DRAFT_1326025 [Cyathus striatus]